MDDNDLLHKEGSFLHVQMSIKMIKMICTQEIIIRTFCSNYHISRNDLTKHDKDRTAQESFWNESINAKFEIIGIIFTMSANDSNSFYYLFILFFMLIILDTNTDDGRVNLLSFVKAPTEI